MNKTGENPVNSKSCEVVVKIQGGWWKTVMCEHEPGDPSFFHLPWCSVCEPGIRQLAPWAPASTRWASWEQQIHFLPTPVESRRRTAVTTEGQLTAWPGSHAPTQSLFSRIAEEKKILLTSVSLQGTKLKCWSISIKANFTTSVLNRTPMQALGPKVRKP